MSNEATLTVNALFKKLTQEMDLPISSITVKANDHHKFNGKDIQGATWGGLHNEGELAVHFTFSTATQDGLPLDLPTRAVSGDKEVPVVYHTLRNV